VGPLASTDITPPPIYSRYREKPNHPSLHPLKVPSWPPLQTLARESSESLPGTLPEGEILARGIYIVMPAFEVMREYFIPKLWVHSSS
jgi:hypothetical protein